MSTTQPPIPSLASDIATRVLYMLMFAVVFWLLCWALAVTAVLQLILRLSSGQPNAELTRIGARLGAYARAIIEFLTFASDVVPYPFTPWSGP